MKTIANINAISSCFKWMVATACESFYSFINNIDFILSNDWHLELWNNEMPSKFNRD